MKPEAERRIDEIRKIKAARDELRALVQEKRTEIKALDEQEDALWLEIESIESGDSYQTDLRDQP